MSLTERGSARQWLWRRSLTARSLGVRIAGGHRPPLQLTSRKVAPRVYRPVVQPNFVVEVRRSASARASNEADDVVLVDPLSHMDVESGEVAVACGQAITMIEDDQVAVSCFSLSVNNDTVRRRQHSASIKRRNVQALVQFRLTVEWISSISVVTRDITPNRPDIGREPHDVIALFGDLLQQFHLAFKVGRPVLQQVDPGLQIHTAEQVSCRVIHLGTANCRNIGLRETFGPTPVFNQVGQSFGQAFQGGKLAVEFDGGYFQVSLLDFEIDVFGLELVIVGDLERHSGVVKSEPNGYKK